MGGFEVVDGDLEVLRAELLEFERRFDTPSARLADVFARCSDTEVETPELRRWATVYAILRRARMVAA